MLNWQLGAVVVSFVWVRARSASCGLLWVIWYIGNLLLSKPNPWCLIAECFT